MNIYDLISRAQKLRKETQLDSVSPDRVGGLHEDTLKYINEFQLLASSPSLHKIYASVSAMQSDKSPKSDLTGKPLKPGQLVVIVPANQTDATAGDVYRYDGPSGNTSAWTFVAKIGAVPADAELSATSTNPPQNKVVTEKLTELESDTTDVESAISAPIMGEEMTSLSTEQGYLNNVGGINASTLWKTSKYDVAGCNVVFLTGTSSKAGAALAATYNENDELIRTFCYGTGQEYVDMPIPVVGATYIKVSRFGEYNNPTAKVLSSQKLKDLSLLSNAREDIKNLQNAVALMTKSLSTIELKAIETTTGILNENGTINGAYAAWQTSKFDVSGLELIFVTGNSSSLSALACLYDKDDKLISTIAFKKSASYNDFPIAINGASYIRVSINNATNTAKVKSCFLADLMQSNGVAKSIETLFATNYGESVSYDEIGTGIIDADGKVNSSYGFWRTAKFNISENPVVYITGGASSISAYASLYDINDRVIKVLGFGANESVTNKPIYTYGASYIRVSIYGKNNEPSVRIVAQNISDEKFLAGKKVVFLGDSITQGGQGSGDEQVTSNKVYHKVFADITGCANINAGQGGTAIVVDTIGTYATIDNCFKTRVTPTYQMDTADVIVVWGGTNDFSHDNHPIGESFVLQDITASGEVGSKKKVAPTDVTTFAGALHDLVLTIRSINPTAQIVFMTPLNRGRYGSSPTSKECNQWGDFMDDFRNCIKDVCGYYCIPVFDIASICQLDFCNEEIAAKLSVDNLHPNASGHKIIGSLLAKWFKTNIAL